MADAHKNFSYSTVLTSPSPATSGTSLVLASGGGALMPAVPFNATIWPTGSSPLSSNAEIVRVTAIATDTLTISRTQESSSARTVVVGDQFAATVTKKTLNDIEDSIGRFYNVMGPTYGAKGDGTTDDTTAIQAALTAAAAAGGGVVYLPAATYVVTNLTIGSYVTLQGAGRGTLLQSKAASTGYILALTTPASTQQVHIRDITLKPNVGTCGGINLDNTGFGTSIDPLHVVENVVVLNAGGDAFRFDNSMRELKVLGCYAHYSGGYGFYVGTGCTDGRFIGNTTGPTTSHGYEIVGNNNNFIGCKAFYAGYNGSTWNTTSDGFHLNGTNYSTLTSCSAQQNALHGFSVESCSRITLTGCETDTNSAGTTTGVGINTFWTTNSFISGNVGGNNGILSPGAQKYGVQVDGTQTGLYLVGNAITGSSGNFGYVSGSGYILIDNTVADLSGIPTKINDVTLFALAGATSGITTVSPAATASGTWTLPAATDTFVGRATTDTLTNKRVTARINTTASSATPAINTDTTDQFNITALAVNITSMTSSLTGTPTDGQKLLIRITGTAARTITWGTSFQSSGTATLLATTATTKTHLISLVYDSVVAKWVCMAVDATGY